MRVLATGPEPVRVAGVRDELDASGVGRWEGALHADTVALLTDEARRLRPSAELVETTEYDLGGNGQKVRSPMRFRAAFAREALQRVHESDILAELASELSGCEMQPTETAYLYFGRGDFIGLHTDIPACELTFLVPLGAAAPPLVAHPELRGREPSDLLELARQTHGAPDGGLAFPLPADGLLVLTGQVAPHQTRPVGDAADAVLATLCFAGRAA